MTADDIEPLQPEVWFTEIDKLRARQNEPGSQATDALLRKAFYLVQLAPAPLKEIFPCRVEEETMEEFLDCGAYATAALALFGPPVGVSIVRQAGSQMFEASVSLPDTRSVFQNVDREPANAMLGAWCQAVSALSGSGDHFQDSQAWQTDARIARH